jgi:epoxyqueuosine reductase
VCQSVCPWNGRFGRPTADPAFAPRPSLAAPDPAGWLRLSQEEFSARLRGSPLKRARRAGLARNAAVVAGNLRRPSDVPALAGALSEDPSPIVRVHAAWALGRIGNEPARHRLRQALALELEADVRAEITAALA